MTLTANPHRGARPGVLALVIALLTSGACTRRTSIGVGIVTLALGTGTLLEGKFGPHSNEGPDATLVAYPLGIGLLIVGACSLMYGLESPDASASPAAGLRRR